MSSGEANPRSYRRAPAPLPSLPPGVPRYAVEGRFAWCADSNATPPPIMWCKLLCSRKTATAKASEFHRGNPADDQDADNFRNDSIDQKTRADLRQPQSGDVFISDKVEKDSRYNRKATDETR